DGVIKRFDAETIARREQHLVSLIPQREREFAPQMLQAMRPQILIQVQRDLAIRTRPKPMAALFQFAPLPLEIIEFAINDDAIPFVFARDGLMTPVKINDA